MTEEFFSSSSMEKTGPAVDEDGGRPLSRDVGQIFAAVLTYNRKETALVCLRALLAQTRLPDRIVLLDNGSSDGTKDFLTREGILGRKEVTFLRTEENIGPAAGFAALFEHAYRAGCNWIWIMDDDVIPDPNALEELVSAFVANFDTPESIGLLATRLRTPNGEPNNVPEIDNRETAASPARWAELLDRGLVRIKWSTLCGDLIPRSTIERFGIPLGVFFYGGEDIEYTQRVTAERPAYLVGRSGATHLRAVGKFHPLAENNPSRVPLYYYFYRNQLYLRRRFWGRYVTLRFIVTGVYNAVRVAFGSDLGLKLSVTMLRGLAAGLVFRPDAHFVASAAAVQAIHAGEVRPA